MATKIQAFNLHANVDTHVQGLIDSAYITARASTFDSSNATGLIDSAYISARQQSFDDEAQQDYGLITGSITITKDFGSIA
tara:strand:- start:293 stop:535 length:243 start_codon:yes stop_codon:yes gene_type:complete